VTGTGTGGADPPFKSVALIGLGLIGSGVSLAILLGLAVLLRRHGMGMTRQDVLSSTAVEGSS